MVQMIGIVRKLLVLVVLLQSIDLLLALPDALDKALIYMGKSDKDLKRFYDAMSNHQFGKMEKFYKKANEGWMKLKEVLGTLLQAKIREDTKAFKLKEALAVQMQILKGKMASLFGSKTDIDQE